MCKQASTLGIQVGVKKGASMSPIWEWGFIRFHSPCTFATFKENEIKGG